MGCFQTIGAEQYMQPESYSGQSEEWDLPAHPLPLMNLKSKLVTSSQLQSQ